LRAGVSRQARLGLIDGDHVMVGKGERQRPAAFAHPAARIEDQRRRRRHPLAAFEAGVEGGAVVVAVRLAKRRREMAIEQRPEMLVDAPLGAGRQAGIGVHRQPPAGRFGLAEKRRQGCPEASITSRIGWRLLLKSIARQP